MLQCPGLKCVIRPEKGCDLAGTHKAKNVSALDMLPASSLTPARMCSGKAPWWQISVQIEMYFVPSTPFFWPWDNVSAQIPEAWHILFGIPHRLHNFCMPCQILCSLGTQGVSLSLYPPELPCSSYCSGPDSASVWAPGESNYFCVKILHGIINLCVLLRKLKPIPTKPCRYPNHIGVGRI